MAKLKKVNKKHFIIFNNGGVVSTTTPKDWARAHQNYLKNLILLMGTILQL